SVRGQGVPSLASLRDDAQSLRSWRSITYCNHDRKGLFGSAFDLLARADFAVEEDAYRSSDPVASADSTYRTLIGGGSARVQRIVFEQGLAYLSPELRIEHLGQDNRLVPSRAVRAQRASGALTSGLDLYLFRDRLILDAQARLDVQVSAGDTGNVFSPSGGRISRTDFEPTFTLGFRLQAHGPIAVRGSLGRRYRSPTFYELFGDRGTFVGNERLQPEL